MHTQNNFSLTNSPLPSVWAILRTLAYILVGAVGLVVIGVQF